MLVHRSTGQPDQWVSSVHPNVEMIFKDNWLEFFDGQANVVFTLNLEPQEVRFVFEGSTCYARIGHVDQGNFPYSSRT